MPKSKLTPEEINYIKNNFVAGDPKWGIRAIAKRYNMSPSTVSKMLYKKIPFACLYNKGVECLEQANCERCGWNPEIEAIRKARLERRG